MQVVRFSFLSVLLCLFLCLSSDTQATIDAYPFPNEELRERYDKLIAELRCPQCLNTNLAGSDAMIAQDLRREVHRMLLDGASDDEILDFMHERYGDFILYEPRLGPKTFVLWFGPVTFLLIALAVLIRMMRAKTASTPLSLEDKQRVASLLEESDTK